ncbi:molybdenum cofactor guanylyltransferase [Paenibacillus thiaminolyticus]|uniref:molybdenum cofactor guanylyltransferase n=1 Tax=Paenibacillus thiaminolyticus TaxID=49283 RepID=UPI00232ACEB4|nr:molybdenum cofactor guanylyltransferase [Paenibacillus thiaminolyticus]WCF06006.1 molybdenum cofactor guanylyltransferase [Paenibacillus thiaminolyticus]
MTVSGVILAGGRNSRMNGMNKALLRIQGDTFIEQQVCRMRELCRSILVVTPDPALYTGILANVQYVSDIYPGRGPLSGLHAAFRIVPTEYAWVVGCDYPAISAQAAEWMRHRAQEGDYDAVLPIAEGSHQMLHALYRPRRLLPIITERIRAGRHRLSGLLESCRWLGITEEEWIRARIPLDFIRDVDTPGQYEALLNECAQASAWKEESGRGRSETQI